MILKGLKKMGVVLVVFCIMMSGTNVLEAFTGTRSQEEKPNAQLDYLGNGLSNLETSAIYDINGITLLSDASGKVELDESFYGKNIALVKKGVGDNTDSESQALAIPNRGSAPSGVVGGFGTISSVTTSMEYKLSTDLMWKNCTTTSISGLKSGAYYVRYKSTASAFASKNNNVVVGEKGADATGAQISDFVPGNGTITDALNGSVKSFVGTASTGSSTDSSGMHWYWNNSSAGGSGLRVDTNKDISQGYTIAIKFSFSKVSGWNKIVDYQNRATDSGFYFLSGKVYFYPRQSGTTVIAPNQVVELIVTRDAATKKFSVFLVQGGKTSEEFSYIDSANEAMPYTSGGKTRFGFFYDDSSAGSEYSPNGKCYSIKIWDYAMTQSQAENVLKPYTVKYNTNGGTGGPSDTAEYKDGQTVTVKNGVPTKDNYVFGGWENQYGGIYNAGQTFKIKAQTELKAIWQPLSYSVLLNPNQGTTSVSKVSARYNELLPTVAIPTRTGYNFAGYNDSNNVRYYNEKGVGIKLYDKKEMTMLTAEWIPKPINFPTKVLTNAKNQNAYSETINTATVDGAKIISYEIISGSLVDGLTLDIDGSISGTPTKAGTSTFEVKATADNTATATRSFNLNIDKADGAGISVVMADWTAGKTPSVPSLSGTLVGDYGAPIYQYRNGTTWSTTIPTAIGSYGIRAKYATTSNYNEYITGETTFKIVEKQLSKIEVSKPQTKEIYAKNGTYDKTGLEINAIFNNGTTSTISANDITVVQENFSTVGLGSVELAYTFGNVTKTVVHNVTIKANVLTVEATTNIVGIESGTLESDFKLPKEVSLKINDGPNGAIEGYYNADVSWKIMKNQPGFDDAYDPAIITEQNLKYEGIITLPDTLVNENNVVLKTYITVKVDESIPNLVSIQKPSDLSGISSGTKIEELEKLLPTTVSIATVKGKEGQDQVAGSQNSQVDWIQKGTYNPLEIREQNVEFEGTITLPQSPNPVTNTNGVILKTKMTINVKGAVLSNIKIETLPKKLLYNFNDLFDTTGLSLKAIYSNTFANIIAEKDITTSIKNNEALVNIGKQSIEAAYEYGNVKQKDDFEIEVKHKIETITWPEDKTGVLNGTLFKELNFPATVKVETSGGVIDLAVVYDTTNYDPTNKYAKTYVIKASVTIPDIYNNVDVSTTKSINVSVNEEIPDYIGFVEVADIVLSDLPPISVEGFQLPKSVLINTATLGKQFDASVQWDLTNVAYDPTITEEQKFSVPGVIVLPDGITNSTSKSLNVTVNITSEFLPLDSIEITKKPDKVVYDVDTYFDPTGMEVSANFAKDDMLVSKVITQYDILQVDALSDEINKITISYTESGINKTVDLPILVKSREATPQPIINYRNEMITYLNANREYRINGDLYTSNDQGNIKIVSKWFNKTINMSLVTDQPDTHMDSLAMQLVIPSRLDAPLLTTYNTKIIGTTEAMEFSVIGESVYTACTNNEVILPQGQYIVRYKATDEAFASKNVILSISDTQAVMPTYNVSGTIKDANGNILVGHEVLLFKGNSHIANMFTVADGMYHFAKIPDGYYNIEVVTDTCTMVESIYVNGGNSIVDVTLPKGNVTTALEFGQAAPNVVIGQLVNQFKVDTLNKVSQDNKGITNADMLKDTIQLSVKINEVTKENADRKKIEALIGNKAATFVDLSLNKEIDKNQKIELEETGENLAIHMPIPQNIKGKDNIGVYRVHNGKIDILSKDVNTEHFTVEKDYINIYANKFSVYGVVGWDNVLPLPQVSVYTMTGDTTKDVLYILVGLSAAAIFLIVFKKKKKNHN